MWNSECFGDSHAVGLAHAVHRPISSSARLAGIPMARSLVKTGMTAFAKIATRRAETHPW